MGKNDKISERQLTVLIFISLMSPMIRILPHSAVLFAGRAAWLSPIAAFLAGAVFLGIIRALKKNSVPGDGLTQMAIKSLGGVIGRIFCIICALWLTFYAGFIVRSAAERLLSSVYPNGNTVPLIIVTLLVAMLTASGNTKSLARTAEVFMPILLIVIITTVAAALTDVETKNLLPVTYLDTGKVFLGAIPIFDVMGLYVYFLFLYGYVEKPKSGKPKRFPWLAVLSAVACLVLIVTIGTVSEKLALSQQNAFFMIIRNIRLLGIIERLESVVLAVWVITDFTILGALFIIVSEIWHTVLNVKKRKLFVLPTGALSAVSSFLIAGSAFSLVRWSSVIIPAANLVLTVVIVPLVLLVGKLRKKI